MRVFSQSLQGNVKKWFRQLQPRSITTWGEFSHAILGFWGEGISLDQILSKFYYMKKHKGETMSSFKRRFEICYYSMPKEIQPLEGAAKLLYTFVFPPKMSLLILERKSITLQNMFDDSLEVEDNLRISKRFLGLGCNDKVDKETSSVELCGEEETFSWKPTTFSSRNKEDQYDDGKVGGSTNLFCKDCNQPVAGCVPGN